MNRKKTQLNFYRKSLRLVHTLGYLKFTQFLYFLFRRYFPARSVNLLIPVSINCDISLAQPIAWNGGFQREIAFQFLNVSKDFSQSGIDWCSNDVSRLWNYNLHYFDYLRHVDCDSAIAAIIIDDWIESNPQNSEPGWEPFTVSLRIVNWIFFLFKNPICAKGAVLESLYLQCLWLEKNDERHILANHYFENMKAILFAGVYFQGDDAIRWREKGLATLVEEVNEQSLVDGGHFERSPQYHSLMLENYLDLYNLTSKNRHIFDVSAVNVFANVANAALDWLNTIVFPNNEIPLFNDSALNASPTTEELNDYAAVLFGYEYFCEDVLQLINLDDSGLYGIKSADSMLLMDAGEIGPSYQPGHTHCDFLSYELMVKGEKLVVNTGVYEYQPGALRQYLRSTKAHNTVSIDDGEQSEIWGEFRVGRRAKKHFGMAVKRGNEVQIDGAFSGFYGPNPFVGPKYRHSRSINVKLVKDRIRDLDVVDRLDGHGDHLVESYIHIHPRYRLSVVDERRISIELNGVPYAELLLEDGANVRIEPSIYCPEFGLKLVGDNCIVVSKETVLPTQISYQLCVL